MTDQEKRNYNKQHYQKNKEAILGKVKSKYKPKKQSNLNVVPLFKRSQKTTETPNTKEPKATQLSWGTVFLQVFVAVMSGFLIHETARFYTSVDGTQASAYLKALILEGAVFAFALMKARTTFTGGIYKTMILLIYLYSAWAISGSVIQNAYHQHSQMTFHEKAVTELESEIQKRTLLRDTLFGSRRITLAINTDRTLAPLKVKLDSSREALLKLPQATVIWNTLLTLVVFRILVMVTNLLCLRELGRSYKTKLKTT